MKNPRVDPRKISFYVVAFFDLILLIILGGFVLFGLWFGFIHSLGALIGTILGALLASRWYDAVAQAVFTKIGGSLNITRVVVFLIIFVSINRLVGFLFWMIEKFTGIFTRLPFLKSVNKMVGGLFGLVEGVFVLGLTLILSAQLPLMTGLIEKSKVAKELMDTARILIPLFPEALRAVQQIPQIQLPTIDTGKVQEGLKTLEDVKALQELVK